MFSEKGTTVSQNIELALLTKVVIDRDFHSLERAQITEEFFSSPEAVEVYKFLRAMYHNQNTSGEVPSMEMLQMHFPGFYPFPTNDSVRVLASELRREKVRTEALLLAQNLNEVVVRDPLAAIAFLRSESAKISALAEVGEDLTLAGAFQMLKDQYENITQAGGCIGIPYPWHPLNVELQGMQGGQLIYFFGRPKSMKTWIACYIASHAYTHARARVLVYTKEMSPRQIAQRIACCVCRVDYQAFKNGTLQPAIKQQVFQNLQDLMDDEQYIGIQGYTQPYIRIISDRGGQGGVGWLSAKIREYRPDLVIADGVYLMGDDRGSRNQQEWSRVMHISRDLKLCAQEHDVPVIGFTQANRGADKSGGTSLSDMAYSDALAQDGDAVFYVEKVEVINEQTKEKHTELNLKGTGLREAKLEGIVVRGCPATDFSYIRAWTSGDGNREEYQQARPKQFRPPQFDPRLPPPVRPT